MRVLRVTGAGRKMRYTQGGGHVTGFLDDIAAAGESFVQTAIATVTEPTQEFLEASLPLGEQQVVQTSAVASDPTLQVLPPSEDPNKKEETGFMGMTANTILILIAAYFLLK